MNQTCVCVCVFAKGLECSESCLCCIGGVWLYCATNAVAAYQDDQTHSAKLPTLQCDAVQVRACVKT